MLILLCQGNNTIAIGEKFNSYWSGTVASGIYSTAAGDSTVASRCHVFASGTLLQPEVFSLLLWETLPGQMAPILSLWIIIQCPVGKFNGNRKFHQCKRGSHLLHWDTFCDATEFSTAIGVGYKCVSQFFHLLWVLLQMPAENIQRWWGDIPGQTTTPLLQ